MKFFEWAKVIEEHAGEVPFLYNQVTGFFDPKLELAEPTVTDFRKDPQSGKRTLLAYFMSDKHLYEVKLVGEFGSTSDDNRLGAKVTAYPLNALVSIDLSVLVQPNKTPAREQAHYDLKFVIGGDSIHLQLPDTVEAIDRTVLAEYWALGKALSRELR